ncbi:hypothetical protein HN873_013082 [Arachis hypogaea]
MEEFRAASQKLGDSVGVKSLMQSTGLGMIAGQNKCYSIWIRNVIIFYFVLSTGAVAIAVANPTDLVKVRIQAEGKLPLRIVEKKCQEVEARVRELDKQVKLLVRKWKEIVDEGVRLNQPGETASLMADGDSPPLKTTQNGHHQIPDFVYSPNPHVASLTERSLCLIQNQSQCLANLCGALHCDIEINFGLKKSKCNIAAAARNKHLCESLVDSCFPVNDGPVASRLLGMILLLLSYIDNLSKFFLHQFCDANSCTGSRKPFSRGRRRDEKGNSIVEAHLSNWQKEKTILMDKSVAFGSSCFSNTFRIHRSLLICDSGYCTPNLAIGECS